MEAGADLPAESGVVRIPGARERAAAFLAELDRAG
jgi:hypothetical protein